MPRYGVVTYKSRKKSNNTSAQTQFDLALAARNKPNAESEGCNSNKSGSRKTMNSEKKDKRQNASSDASKKRKLNPLLEDELFGFNGSDSEIGLSIKRSKSPSKTRLLPKQNSPTKADLTVEISSPFGTTPGSPFKSRSPLKSTVKSKDSPLKKEGKLVTFKHKNTDDKECQHSKDPVDMMEKDGCSVEEKKKQSPFKRFLKNNVVSLTPKKQERFDRRFSALPTNSVQCDKEQLKDSQKITKASSWPIEASSSSSRVRVNREEKKLFTVVRNVKHKYACLEDGETQQFFDDVEFALDGLRKDLSLGARCTSALDLAVQCSTPSFRASLRAHGFISKIFECLQDAPTNKTLALCSSCVLFMITRDRLCVDFDHSILELLLKLLCIGTQSQKSEMNVKKNLHEEMVKKTREILIQLSESHTMFLDMENLSSASLARESLLSLTSQRTGEWFKEGVRKLGGLDYIVDLVSTSVVNIKDNTAELIKHDKEIESIKRCLKLIENVTLHDRANQIYLVSCRKSSLVVALSRLLRVCIQSIIEDHLVPESIFFKMTLDCVKSIMRVYLNLTHDNDGESETIGQQASLIPTLLLCVLQVPQFVSAEEQFDILVLALGLLINLMEHSKQNIASLVVLKTRLSYEDSQNSLDSIESGDAVGGKEVSALEALVNLFQLREQAARDALKCAENGSDDELKLTQDGLGWVCGEDIDLTKTEEPDVDKSSQEDSENTQQQSLEDEIGSSLKKAGKHMEDSMVASYVALLLGCLAKDNNANQNLIRQLLPMNNFDVLINTLETFLRFMKLTSGTTGQAIEKIIHVLKNC
ncbi:wings apart-like protein homolog [Dendronephthya gigantea]|uniref:wings apart-like protein homolog n=1 Tax=Dendronephthya gigantea TaxID=151771 RepID=UPI001069E8DF|nr:wings apart-like protein homolog [Dendronephthya gigantea]